jgi:Uma2 family endonuclease
MGEHPRLRPMLFEEFLAFAQRQPDGERWELIDGVPTVSPSPTDFHQVILINLARALMIAKMERNAPWLPLLGITTPVPARPDRAPMPDLMAKADPATGAAHSDEALVVFEILSRSNTRKDREWRWDTYRQVAGAEHYVTVDGRRLAAVRFDRARDWEPDEVNDLSSALVLPALALAIPLATVYRYTPLGVAHDA